MHGVSCIVTVAICAIAHWHHQVRNVMTKPDNVPVCLELLDKCVKSVSTATGIMDLPDAPVCFNTNVLVLISASSN